MVPGQHAQTVGADLVRRVAVGRDAVGADDDRLHLAGPHERRGHRVADEGRVELALLELPRREPGPLQQWPGLVGVHLGGQALLVQREQDRQRRAVAARGEHAGVAVRQHAGALAQRGEQLGAVPTDRRALGAIRFVNRLRLGEQAFGELGGRQIIVDRTDHRPHPIERPEQIDRGRSAGR